jgi:hypothetical protein
MVTFLKKRAGNRVLELNGKKITVPLQPLYNYVKIKEESPAGHPDY